MFKTLYIYVRVLHGFFFSIYFVCVFNNAHLLTTNLIDFESGIKLYDALLDIDPIKANYQTFNMNKIIL